MYALQKNWKGVCTSLSMMAIFLASLLGISQEVLAESLVQAELGHEIHIPIVMSGSYVSTAVTGRVVDSNGIPIGNATIATEEGRFTFSDVDGNYAIVGLSEGVHVFTVSKTGYNFSPESRTVVLEELAGDQNFTANLAAACYNDVANSGFEITGAWHIPYTAYTAGYSTARVHGGSWGMRTGIVDPTHNRYSFSPFRQSVTIPAGASSALLRYWMYPMTSETTPLTVPKPEVGVKLEEITLAGDVQYLLILDQYGNIINTLIWQRENTQVWTLVEVNMLSFAGRTIQIHFGTYNDGAGGITSVFVDDVSMEICDFPAANTISGRVTDAGSSPVSGVTITSNTGATATTDIYGLYSISGLANGTYTLTPSKTGFTFTPATITATVPPSAANQDFTANLTATCYEEIANGDYETTTAWEIPITAYTAGYSANQAHGGTRSMRTGIALTADNRYSYSAARQTVNIPANVAKATLDYWIFPVSGDVAVQNMPQEPELGTFFEGVGATLAGDVQYVLLLNQYNQIIHRILWQRTNTQQWENYAVDLSTFAGRVAKVHFGTYNDGWGGITTMYVDDVSLEICVP